MTFLRVKLELIMILRGLECLVRNTQMLSEQ